MMAEPEPEFMRVEPGGVVFRVQASVYGEQAIAAALHRFTDRCFVHMERADDWVVCRVVPAQAGADGRALAGALANEMLDQKLRARLQEETEPIRRLLLAQVFSRTNIAHPELDEIEPERDKLDIGRPDAPPRPG